MTCFCGVSKCGDSLGLLLVGDRTDVSQGGMESLSIVKRLQVLKDRLPSLCPALKGLPIDAIGFRRAKEALLQRVVIIIPFSLATSFTRKRTAINYCFHMYCSGL